MISFTPRPIYHRDKNQRYPFAMRPTGP